MHVGVRVRMGISLMGSARNGLEMPYGKQGSGNTAQGRVRTGLGFGK